MDEIIGFFPTNENSLHLLHLFYSDNEIIIVHGRPAICTLIGWFKSSRLFISLSGFCDLFHKFNKIYNLCLLFTSLVLIIFVFILFLFYLCYWLHWSQLSYSNTDGISPNSQQRLFHLFQTWRLTRLKLVPSSELESDQ